MAVLDYSKLQSHVPNEVGQSGPYTSLVNTAAWHDLIHAARAIADDVGGTVGMPHRRLAHPVLILGYILVKVYLARTVDGGDSSVRAAQAQRGLLQSAAANQTTCEAIDEYDPALDSPVELQSLTALYSATGGPYWTYGSFFQTNLQVPDPRSVANETAETALVQRFNRTAWLDFSVSYCQWCAAASEHCRLFCHCYSCSAAVRVA